MKRILVTGSNGQLGLTLQELAAKYTEFQFEFTDIGQLDITDKENLHAHLKNNHFDYCINCAAYTDVEQAEKFPAKAYLINAEGVKNLALACTSNHITLVHISTDYVFDGEKEGPYVVGDRTNPINEYGKSKLEGEEHIRKILSNHFIIRTSWLYSKKFGHNFYRTILKKAREEQVLHITDAQLGCPTDAKNLASYILKLIKNENQKFGTYHYTDNIAMTWFDFAKLILQENGLMDTVKLVLDRNYRTFAKRPKNSVLS